MVKQLFRNATPFRVFLAFYWAVVLVARLHLNQWIGVTAMLIGFALIAAYCVRALWRRFQPKKQTFAPTFPLGDGRYSLTVRRNGETVVASSLHGPALVTVKAGEVSVRDRDGIRSY